MKNKILKVIIVMIILVMTFGSNIVYATGQTATETTDGGGGGSSASSSGGSTGDGTIQNLDRFKPSINLPSGGKAEEIIESILGALTVIGIIGIVISFALIGFSSILGSASEKAQGQEKYVGIVIAAVIITGGSIIARLIISVAENL